SCKVWTKPLIAKVFCESEISSFSLILAITISKANLPHGKAKNAFRSLISSTYSFKIFDLRFVGIRTDETKARQAYLILTCLSTTVLFPKPPNHQRYCDNISTLNREGQYGVSSNILFL